MKKYRYKGIKTYTPDDSEIFFGRDNVIKELFHFIKYEQIYVIYAKPGFGKSSLINAGLYPKFENEFHGRKKGNMISDQGYMNLSSNNFSKFFECR